MKYQFVPPGKPFHDHDDNGSGIQSLPRALLDRHGARVLHPAEVPVADGWPMPRSTVYRARTLLLPQRLQTTRFLGPVTDVLARVGMHLVPVPTPTAVAAAPELADVPTIAVLEPIRVPGRPCSPGSTWPTVR